MGQQSFAPKKTVIGQGTRLEMTASVATAHSVLRLFFSYFSTEYPFNFASTISGLLINMQEKFFEHN